VDALVLPQTADNPLSLDRRRKPISKMHPGNPLSLRQLAVRVAVLYLVASVVLVLKWWMR
jgi:hypothetical protein